MLMYGAGKPANHFSVRLVTTALYVSVITCVLQSSPVCYGKLHFGGALFLTNIRGMTNCRKKAEYGKIRYSYVNLAPVRPCPPWSTNPSYGKRIPKGMRFTFL